MGCSERNKKKLGYVSRYMQNVSNGSLLFVSGERPPRRGFDPANA